MDNVLIECVPNISEGRNLEIINSIVESAKRVKGVKVLGCEPDSDYNRTVITIAGDPVSVTKGAHAIILKSLELIDMSKHSGNHPRMGAVDVCPFVPLSDNSMEHCIQSAKDLSELISEKIPHFFYGEAATSEQRVSLSSLRKMEYEGLESRFNGGDWGNEETRMPDCWSGKWGDNESRFGAVAIGARNILVAYNVNVNETDAKASKIAGSMIRTSGRLIKKDGKKMRINTNLVSTKNEISVWSKNFDLSVDEVFDVQDKIAEEIVSTIVGRVEADHLNTLKTKRPENMAAYDLVLQGLEYAKKGNVVKQNTENAVKYFEKAIELEPSYARAHAWRACSLSNLADWQENPDPKLAKDAIESINLALELDPTEPEVHRIMGSIKLWRERDHDLARYHFEKAKELCPSDVFILSRYVNLLIYLGEFKQALNELMRAMRLDPFSHDLLFGPEAICHFWLENYDLALDSFSKIKVARTHMFYNSLVYFKKGETFRASKKLQEAIAITGFDIDSFANSEPYKEKEIVASMKKDLSSLESY